MFYKSERNVNVTNVNLNLMFNDPMHDDSIIITNREYRRGYMLVGNKLIESDQENEINMRM